MIILFFFGISILARPRILMVFKITSCCNKYRKSNSAIIACNSREIQEKLLKDHFKRHQCICFVTLYRSMLWIVLGLNGIPQVSTPNSDDQLKRAYLPFYFQSRLCFAAGQSAGKAGVDDIRVLMRNTRLKA